MSTQTTTKANWIKSVTAGQSVEIRVSDKGFVGIFNGGRWVCGMPASVFSTLFNNPEEIMNLALDANTIRESGAKQREEAKLKSKLEKEAIAMLKKAEMFQQAGIDLAALLAKKQA